MAKYHLEKHQNMHVKHTRHLRYISVSPVQQSLQVFRPIKPIGHRVIVHGIRKTKKSMERLFVGFGKDGLLAELQARMSKSRRFLLFLPQR